MKTLMMLRFIGNRVGKFKVRVHVNKSEHFETGLNNAIETIKLE